MPTAPESKHVVILAYEGLALFEFGVAVEVFGQDRPEVGDPWYRCSVSAAEPGPQRATGGVTVGAQAGLELLSVADIIVVPGWNRSIRAPALEEALKAAHKRGARLVSICTGAFLLGACGLLDGRRATTHWLYIDELERRYPHAEVVRDVLYVDEESVLTSAGSAAGVDLCLHVVRQDFGGAIANMVARRMVVAAHREGGQRQFIEMPIPREHEAGRLAGLLDHLRAEIHLPFRIDVMARQVGMSHRTFIRRFKEVTGLAPGQWITLERVARARHLLETSNAPIEEVSRLCGIGTPAGLRHHFAKHVGITPTLYRRRFGLA